MSTCCHARIQSFSPLPSLRRISPVQLLRQKAEERNPDEFYFAMEKARTRDGVHVAATTEANKYSQEELRLMKTQDIGYLQLKAQTEAKVGCLRLSVCCAGELRLAAIGVTKKNGRKLRKAGPC